MVTVIRPSRARRVNGTIPRRERAVPNSAGGSARDFLDVYDIVRLAGAGSVGHDATVARRIVSDAIAAPLSISIGGPRPSWPGGRGRPRWCAPFFMATSNTCVRLSIIVPPPYALNQTFNG